MRLVVNSLVSALLRPSARTDDSGGAGLSGERTRRLVVRRAEHAGHAAGPDRWQARLLVAEVGTQVLDHALVLRDHYPRSGEAATTGFPGWPQRRGPAMSLPPEPTSWAGRLPGRIRARTRGRCHDSGRARRAIAGRAASNGGELLWISRFLAFPHDEQGRVRVRATRLRSLATVTGEARPPSWSEPRFTSTPWLWWG